MYCKFVNLKITINCSYTYCNDKNICVCVLIVEIGQCMQNVITHLEQYTFDEYEYVMLASVPKHKCS